MGDFLTCLSLLSRVVLTVAAVVLASTSFALAETTGNTSTQTTVAQASTPAATPTPNPFTYRGSIRAYDFTRQNAYATIRASSGTWRSTTRTRSTSRRRRCRRPPRGLPFRGRRLYIGGDISTPIRSTASASRPSATPRAAPASRQVSAEHEPGQNASGLRDVDDLRSLPRNISRNGSLGHGRQHAAQ